MSNYCNSVPPHFWTNALPSQSALCPNAIYFIKDETEIKMYVTSYNSIPFEIGKIDFNSTTISSPDNSIEIEQVEQDFKIKIAQSIQDSIASALQPGDNISLLTNDAGYITIADVGTGFIPLSGTVVNDPITGDLEMEGAGGNVNITQKQGTVDKVISFADDDSLALGVSDSSNGKSVSLEFIQNQAQLNVFGTGSKGLVGNTVFDKQNDPEAFAQIQDITDNMPFVTPEQFGAVGDGITDDTEAYQNAINSGKEVVQTKSYLVTTLELPTGTKLSGFGDTKLISNSNNAIITIEDEDIDIKGIAFIGSGKDAGFTSQTAIKVSGTDGERVIITDCRFQDLSGNGFENLNQGNRQTGTIMSDCFFTGCNYAINLHDQGEYNTFSNIAIDECNFGFYNKSGNNSYTGGSIINCGTNVYIGLGSNDGHSVMQGTMINHFLLKLKTYHHQLQLLNL